MERLSSFRVSVFRFVAGILAFAAVGAVIGGGIGYFAGGLYAGAFLGIAIGALIGFRMPASSGTPESYPQDAAGYGGTAPGGFVGGDSGGGDGGGGC